MQYETFDKILAAHLLQIEAIIVNDQKPFTWASGIISPIYCDNRLTLSHPHVRADIVEAFVDITRGLPQFDAVAGVATAGIPHGCLLADRLGLPFVYVRGKAKGHGRRNQIEGKLLPQSKVLVVEDLISTGGSSLAAIQALEDLNHTVVGLTAVFSYELELANRNFEHKDFSVIPLTNMEALISVARDTLQFDPSVIQSLKDWHKDPAHWNPKT